MRFRDSYHIGPEHIQAVQTNFKVQVKDSADNLPDRLLVKVPATHGGFVNKNGFFYRADGMGIGYLTWTNPYKRPVVLYHASEMDPIGRIVSAEFVEDNPMDYVNKFGRTTNIPKCHTDLYFNIVDKAAIEKILNGTYLTVSTAGECDDVRCSICDQDIAHDGICEHSRNKTYDSKLAYWKFGPINYKELSIVNTPADEFAIIEASVEEGATGNSADSICVTPAPYELASGMEILVKDSAEEDMSEKNAAWDGIEFTAEDLEMIKTLDEEVEKFIEDSLSEEDKKLTAAARKALPKSVFCGPPRPGKKEKGTFPVQDCIHYRTAKAFIGRYKGSGDKSKILACIERKGKKLGCGKWKKKGDSEEGNEIFKIEDLLKDTVPAQDFEDEKQKTVELEKVNADLTSKVEELTTKADESTKTSKEALDASAAERKTLLIQTIEDMKILLGDEKIQEAEDPKDAYAKAIKELGERSSESLEDALIDLRGRMFSIKLESVSDPLNKKIKDGVDNEKNVKKVNMDNEKEVAYYHIYKRRLKDA